MHLPALIRSRLGSEEFARLAMLHLSESENYGQLDVHHMDNQMNASPIFPDDLIAFFQAKVPLELQLGRPVIDVPHRHPDVGMDQTEEAELCTRASDGWPYIYLDEIDQTLSVNEEIRLLNLYPDLDGDFVLPLAIR